MSVCYFFLNAKEINRCISFTYRKEEFDEEYEPIGFTEHECKCDIVKVFRELEKVPLPIMDFFNLMRHLVIECKHNFK